MEIRLGWNVPKDIFPSRLHPSCGLLTQVDTFLCASRKCTPNCCSARTGANVLAGVRPIRGQIRTSFLFLLQVLPDLQDLLFCTSIFATLNGINQHQCHTIRWASNLLWSSLVVCAAGMMPLQLLGWYWIRYMEAVRKEEGECARRTSGKSARR